MGQNSCQQWRSPPLPDYSWFSSPKYHNPSSIFFTGVVVVYGCYYVATAGPLTSVLPSLHRTQLPSYGVTLLLIFQWARCFGRFCLAMIFFSFARGFGDRSTVTRWVEPPITININILIYILINLLSCSLVIKFIRSDTAQWLFHRQATIFRITSVKDIYF